MEFSDQVVFVVDDDSAARKSVAALIASKGPNVQAFASAEEFLAYWNLMQRDDSSESADSVPEEAGASHQRGTEPACIICDLKLTGKSGIELQEELVRHGEAPPMIFVTAYGTVPTAVRAMQNGAMTFLEKPCTEQALWDAVATALERHAERVAAESTVGELRRRLAKLSTAEQEVLELLLLGRPNREVAAELGIGLRTAELRRAQIMRKMQASSMAELVQMTLAARGLLRRNVPIRTSARSTLTVSHT